MTKGTEIGEVRGLGSARHGAGHWVLMHTTSAASLITCAYLVISFLLLTRRSPAG
jgi:succinate dehydrogenase / fumarate reductase membrane anchor subunit